MEQQKKTKKLGVESRGGAWPWRSHPRLFGRLVLSGTQIVPLRDGARFVFAGHTFQYLQMDETAAVLCHLNEAGRLAASPDCFVMYSGPLELERNGPESPYGWGLDIGRRHYTL